MGCGGRGSGAANDALGADPNVVLHAVGDAFENNLKAGLKNLQKAAPDKVKVSAENQFVGLDAYQKVINAYGLKAIDIDIEGTPYNTPADQQKTVDALKTIRANNPGITIYITLGSGTSGPDSSLINRAAGPRCRRPF